MLRRNSRARILTPDELVGSKSSPNPRAWTWAGLRAVENPGPSREIPLHLTGRPAGATPDGLLCGGNCGHGFDPLASWVISQARLTAGSSACGWPLNGAGALPPLATADHSWRPPPPTARKFPVTRWLATPSVSRMTILAAPFRPVYPPVQLNWL